MLYIAGYAPYALYCMVYTTYNILHIVGYILYALDCMLCVVYSLLYAMCYILCTLFTLYDILNTGCHLVYQISYIV